MVGSWARKVAVVLPLTARALLLSGLVCLSRRHGGFLKVATSLASVSSLFTVGNCFAKRK